MLRDTSDRSISIMRAFGYPYCLGGPLPLDLSREPKWIRPCAPSSPQVSVSMPHEFYLQFMKWCNLRLKDWWRCQLKTGKASSERAAPHNRESVPPYVLYCLSWISGYDSRAWTPCGARWMLLKIYGTLSEEGMKYVPGIPLVTLRKSPMIAKDGVVDRSVETSRIMKMELELCGAPPAGAFMHLCDC